MCLSKHTREKKLHEGQTLFLRNTGWGIAAIRIRRMPLPDEKELPVARRRGWVSPYKDQPLLKAPRFITPRGAESSEAIPLPPWEVRYFASDARAYSLQTLPMSSTAQCAPCPGPCENHSNIRGELRTELQRHSRCSFVSGSAAHQETKGTKPKDSASRNRGFWYLTASILRFIVNFSQTAYLLAGLHAPRISSFKPTFIG